MKTERMLCAAAIVLMMVTAGCASSERMNRMTDSYSKPSSSRLSGARWANGADRFTGTQINVWPFFTRSNEYYSALWPIFDSDRYGMAVRPFFNQEGDEYAVLFPLCAWNPVNGDGWAVNTYWTKSCSGSFPLFHFGPKFNYVVPGVFWNKDGGGAVIPALTFWGRDDDGDRWFASPLAGGMFSGNPEKNWWMVLNTYGDRDNFGCFPLFHFGPEFNYVVPGVFWDKDGDGAVIPALTFWDDDGIYSLVLMSKYEWNGDFSSFPLLTFYDNQDLTCLPLLTFINHSANSSWFWTPLAGGTYRAAAPEYDWWSVLNVYSYDTGFGMAPLFSWQNDKNGRMLWLLPFFCKMSRSDEFYDNSFRFLFSPFWSQQRELAFTPGDPLFHLSYSWSPEDEREKAAAVAGYTGDVNDREAFTRFLCEKYPESVQPAERTTYGIPLLVELGFADEQNNGWPSPFGLLFSYQEEGDSNYEFTFLTSLFCERKKSSRRNSLSMLMSLIKFDATRSRNTPDDRTLTALENAERQIMVQATLTKNRTEERRAEQEKLVNTALATVREKGIELPENPDWQTVRAIRLKYKSEHPPVAAPPLDKLRWRLFLILASGESTPEAASGQVLWQLWNYQRRGDKSQTRIFPFFNIGVNGDETEYSWIWDKFFSVKSDGDGGLSGRFLFIPW